MYALIYMKLIKYSYTRIDTTWLHTFFPSYPRVGYAHYVNNATSAGPILTFIF